MSGAASQASGEATVGPIAHLYVHVPFCPTICPFCSFHVRRRRDDLVGAYLERLDGELAATAEEWPAGGPLSTVYLGGGTPSHLTDAELERLLRSIRRRFDVAEDAELTIEAHPLNISVDRPRRWRELGINRVSVGIQSTQDAVLRALGRPHDAATALTALDHVLAVDGWTVNADLIVAVPGQDIEADLRRVATTGVAHLAAYTLTIEPGTPFARRRVQVDEDAERVALDAAAAVLPGYGLHRYEVSNHARAGHQCRHNLAYWRGGCWFGAGPSATARLPRPGEPSGGQVLRRNPDLHAWLAGAPPEEEVLDPIDAARTRLLTGLRLAEGVDEAVVQAVGPAARARADRLIGDGLLARRDGRLVATGAGLAVLDLVLAELW
jgi:oxygen-independent coproporphyrinogen-3 oxidase